MSAPHHPVFADRNRVAIERVVNPAPPRAPRQWVVRVPALTDARGKPLWLSSNQRLHWQTHRHLVASWRDQGRFAALNARLPRSGVDRVHVVAVIHYPNSSRNRDAHNLMPTLKAVIDGITSTGFLPDDNDKHLIGPDPRAGEPAAKPCIVLTITEETP